MPRSLLVKFRPTAPWRLAPSSGSPDEVDFLLHSDTLYSAVTSVMADLDLLPDWLQATAEQTSESAVRFTSCFPFQDELLLVTPPRTLWPPAPSARVRWQAARLVPFGVVASLLAGEALNEEQWTVDPVSTALLPAGKFGRQGGPFRVGTRVRSAVDRVEGISREGRPQRCLEFRPGAGFWAAAQFADDSAAGRWLAPLQTAFRLLADTGLGGSRSLGYGHFELPEFREGEWPDLLLFLPVAPPAEEGAAAPEFVHWVLSLFSPAEDEPVDWQQGDYAIVTRRGRTLGADTLKPPARFVQEGSVLASPAALRGVARNVAPEDSPHPVYRAGFAAAISIPRRGTV